MEPLSGIEPPVGIEPPPGIEPPSGIEPPPGIEPPSGIEPPPGIEPVEISPALPGDVRPLLLAATVVAGSTVWAWCSLMAAWGWAGAVEVGVTSATAGSAVVCIAAALIGGGWVTGMLLVIPWKRDWRRRERAALYAGAIAAVITVVLALVAAA
jgi:hypothetical protein